MPRLKLSSNLKAELMSVTRTAVKTSGLKGLDIRNISKEAGCSVGTFYNHFKNMEDLILQFNGITLELLQAKIVDSIQPEDDTKTVIYKICSNYISFASENHSEWLLLLEHRIEGETPEWYLKKVDIFFQKIHSIFQPILGGRKRDIEKGVKILWGSLHGICSLAMRDKIRKSEGLDPLELSQNLFHNYILGHRIGIN